MDIKSRLKKNVVKKILKLFCEDICASKAANILNINRKTVNRFYSLFREKIVRASSITEMSQMAGEFELKAYDGLILNGYDSDRIHHSANEFSREKSHINGIEAFWSFSKRRLAKFNGIASHKFNLHLKECELRFNYRGKKFYNKMLEVIRHF